MPVKSSININPSNLPIGTIVNKWGGVALSNQSNMTNFINNLGKWIPNTSNWFVADSLDTSYAINQSTNRVALIKNSSDYSFYVSASNILQNTINGTTFTNSHLNTTITQTIGTTSATWCSNYTNNKSVFVNCPYGYTYTENGTTFTFVKSPLTSSLHSILTRPFISGSTYSFWDSTNSKRIYTTNHSTFSDVTNFGSSDLQILTMANGHLYTTTGTTLRVSTDDGVTWTSYTLPATTNNSNNHCLDFDGTTYVYGTTTNGLWSSTNLITWTPRTSNISGTPVLQRIWFVNGNFFCLSNTQSATSTSRSTNGTTWTLIDTLGPDILGNVVVYTDSKYFIIGNRIIVSSDLVNWEPSLTGSSSTETDATNRTICNTSTQIAIAQFPNIYIYNSSSGLWTAVSASQQRTGVLGLTTTTVANQYIKVR